MRVDDTRPLIRLSCAGLLLLFLAVQPLSGWQAVRPKKDSAGNPPAAQLTAIRKAVAGNQPGQAGKLLQNALQQYPAWREGWWQMGVLAYEEDDYLGGRFAFSRLVQLDSRSGAAWVMLGLCDFELRDFGLSLLHIQKGRALGFQRDPQLADVARFHQALDLIMVEEYEKAGFILDSFAREDHPSDDVIVAEGLAALHIPAIEPLYLHSADASTLAAVRQAGRAQLAAATKHPDEARKIYQELLQQYPDLPGLHYAYGALLTRWGELHQGIDQFKAELKINPNDVPSHLQIGFSWFKLGKSDAAKAQAAAAVEQSPHSFLAHFLLGQVLLQQGDPAHAAEQLEMSRALEPDSSEVHYALAQAYLRLHRKADAQRERTEFLRLRPLEDALRQRGTLPASAFIPAPDPSASAARR